MDLKSGCKFLKVKVKPNAKQNRLTSFSNNQLEVAIAARPIENQVNKLLIEWLAGLLKVPKTKIKIVRGEHSRLKELALPIEADLAALKTGPSAK